MPVAMPCWRWRARLLAQKWPARAVVQLPWRSHAAVVAGAGGRGPGARPPLRVMRRVVVVVVVLRVVVVVVVEDEEEGGLFAPIQRRDLSILAEFL